MPEEGLDSEAADETELVNSLAELDSHLVQVQTGLRSRSVFLPAPGEGALFWVAKLLLVLKDPAGWHGYPAFLMAVYPAAIYCIRPNKGIKND